MTLASGESPCTKMNLASDASLNMKMTLASVVSLWMNIASASLNMLLGNEKLTIVKRNTILLAIAVFFPTRQ